MASESDRLFIFWSRSTGKYASLRSLLARNGWQFALAVRGSCLAPFNDQDKRLLCLAILDPIGCFSGQDIASIKTFISQGHKVIIANAYSDQEGPPKSNINDLTNELGFHFEENSVIRPNPHKLYHPKETLLEDFVVNRGLEDALVKKSAKSRTIDEDLLHSLIEQNNDETNKRPSLRIIYPYGCTIKVLSRKMMIMMTSSKWALPSIQPICLFHRDDGSKARLIALGSAKMISDDYIDKEDNGTLVSCLMEFITKENFHINMSDARTIEIADEDNISANVDMMLEMPISCFQELEQLPENKLTLMDKSLFSIANIHLPQIIRAYRDLNVPNRPLTLMMPTLSWSLEEDSKTTTSELKFVLKSSSGELKIL